MQSLWIRHAPTRRRGGFGVDEGERLAGRADGFWDAVASGVPSRFGDGDWFSSPLSRAMDTAAALAAACGYGGEIAVEEALAEQNFGEFTGLSHERVAAAHPREYARLWRDPLNYAPPGGESFASFYERRADWWRKFGSTRAKNDCLFVCHSGTIRVMKALAEGLSPRGALALRIPHLRPFLINA